MSKPDAADYPYMFRAMIVRSAQATLSSVDLKASNLDSDISERGFYVLRFALKWPDAWPIARELLFRLSLPIGWQGIRKEWMNLLEQGIAVAELEADTATLAKLYVRLGWYHRCLGQLDTANHYFITGYQLAKELHDEAVQLESLDQLAAIASERSNYQVVHDYVDKIFELVASDDLRRAHAYGALGYVELQQGEFDKAIQAYSVSYQMHLAAGNYRFAAQAEQGLAFVYATARQCEQALFHYQRVIDIFSQYPSVLDFASAQMEMGVVYTYMHDYERALAMYQLCEPMLVKIGSELWLAYLYNNYGLAYTGNRSFDRAESCFRFSIQLGHELDLPRHVANVMDSLGLMYQIQGRLEEAVATWQQALDELHLLAAPATYLIQLLERRLSEVYMHQRNPMSGSPESLVT